MRLATWLAVGLLCTASASAKDACRCADAPRCNAKKPEYVEACLEGDPTNNGTTSAVDEKTTKEECENIEVGGKNVCRYDTPTSGWTWDEWAESKKNSHGKNCDIYFATPHCELLKGTLAQSLQGLLVLAGFSSLLLKKWVEEARTAAPPRDYKTWGLDVSKQAASMTCAHVAGIFNAHILHGSHDMRTDKCAWYSISFTFDTVRWRCWDCVRPSEAHPSPPPCPPGWLHIIFKLWGSQGLSSAASP